MTGAKCSELLAPVELSLNESDQVITLGAVPNSIGSRWVWSDWIGRCDHTFMLHHNYNLIQFKVKHFNNCNNWLSNHMTYTFRYYVSAFTFHCSSIIRNSVLEVAFQSCRAHPFIYLWMNMRLEKRHIYNDGIVSLSCSAMPSRLKIGVTLRSLRPWPISLKWNAC